MGHIKKSRAEIQAEYRKRRDANPIKEKHTCKKNE